MVRERQEVREKDGKRETGSEGKEDTRVRRGETLKKELKGKEMEERGEGGRKDASSWERVKMSTS